MILSWRHDTLYNSVITKYHKDMILSHLCVIVSHSRDLALSAKINDMRSVDLADNRGLGGWRLVGAWMQGLAVTISASARPQEVLKMFMFTYSWQAS